MIPVDAGVLALQGDVAEHVEALREAGARSVREVRRPADLEGLAALVLPGGESTTIGKLMVEYGLDVPLRTRGGRDLALFGTCAGMILLASEIEGRTQPHLGLLPCTVRRNAYGRQVDSFEAEISAPTVSARPIRGVFIRAPRIESVGAGVEVLAAHQNHPVLCRRGKILASAFHPEISGDPALHRYFLDLAGGSAG